MAIRKRGHADTLQAIGIPSTTILIYFLLPVCILRHSDWEASIDVIQFIRI
jgi:hypothetical protein